MPSFGEKLKSEREKRSITLEQISLSTKIGTRMLQALEEEKFSQLPGGIFNKGFVRAYARFVGLDEDQAVADYLEASGEISPHPFEPDAQTGLTPEPVPLASSRELPWGIFAAALLIVALALSIWSYRKREHREPSSSSSPGIAALQKSAAASPAADRQHPGATRNSGLSIPTGQNPEPQKALVADKIPAIKKTSAVATQTEGVESNRPGEFTVLIQAREDSWISIAADGQTVISSMLSAGSQRVVHGRKRVVVKAGNAGGVDFLFNGKKLSSQGEPGDVKTLTFGAEGLQPNLPEPPPTQ